VGAEDDFFLFGDLVGAGDDFFLVGFDEVCVGTVDGLKVGAVVDGHIVGAVDGLDGLLVGWSLSHMGVDPGLRCRTFGYKQAG